MEVDDQLCGAAAVAGIHFPITLQSIGERRGYFINLLQALLSIPSPEGERVSHKKREPGKHTVNAFV